MLTTTRDQVTLLESDNVVSAVGGRRTSARSRGWASCPKASRRSCRPICGATARPASSRVSGWRSPLRFARMRQRAPGHKTHRAMHAHHEGGAEQRRQQVDDRNRRRPPPRKGPATKISSGVLAAHTPHVLDRMIAQRREFEIFAAEEIGVGDEEHDRIDARQQEDARARARFTKTETSANFDASQIAAPAGSGRPGGRRSGLSRSTRSARSSRKKPATSIDTGREHEGQRENEADARRDRQRPSAATASSRGAARRDAARAACRGRSRRGRGRQRQAEHLPQHAAERRRQGLPHGGDGRSEHRDDHRVPVRPFAPSATWARALPARKCGGRRRFRSVKLHAI